MPTRKSKPAEVDHAWFSSRLRDLKTRFPEAKLDVDDQIFKLVQTQTVNEELSRWGDPHRVDPDLMKEWSKKGFLRVSQKMARDIGNWKYSVIYLLMFRASLRISKKCALPFQMLAEKYATLKLDAAYTDNNVEMMGDCLECILYTSSHAGYILTETTRTDRLLAHQMIRDVNKFLDALLHFVFDGDDFTVKQLPSPSFVIDSLELHFDNTGSDSVQPRLDSPSPSISMPMPSYLAQDEY